MKAREVPQDNIPQYYEGLKKGYYALNDEGKYVIVPSLGWDIDDYLPHCGISSTASAYGLARALLSRKSTLIVHCNHHATVRQALVATVTK